MSSKSSTNQYPLLFTRIFCTAGRKTATTMNRKNAPIPIPGSQLVDGSEKMGVAVGVTVIVLVGDGTVAVAVAVAVDVIVRVGVDVDVGVNVTVGGRGVLVGF